MWIRVGFIGCFILLRDFEREELNISRRIIGIGIVSLKNPEVLQCYLPDIFISCPRKLGVRLRAKRSFRGG